MARDGKRLRQIVLLLVFLATVLFFFNQHEMQTSEATHQPPDKFEPPLKQRVIVPQTAVTPVTNNWVDSSSATPRRALNREELKIELKKAALAGEIEKAASPPAEMEEVASGAELRDAFWDQSQNRYKASLTKIRWAEGRMAETVRKQQLTRDEIQAAFDARTEDSLSGESEGTTQLFFRIREWEMQLMVHQGLNTLLEDAMRHLDRAKPQ